MPKTAILVDDDAMYLEKIIQIIVSVPLPEPFRLRRWFASDLAKLALSDSERGEPTTGARDR